MPWKFHKATYLSLLFKFILIERLIILGLYIFTTAEFMNISSILFYRFVEFIMLLYTFSVIYFARLLGTKNVRFVWFHLVIFQILYLSKCCCYISSICFVEFNFFVVYWNRLFFLQYQLFYLNFHFQEFDINLLLKIMDPDSKNIL